MAKISEQIKLKVILEYISGNVSKAEITRRYGINRLAFQMLLAAYSMHGADVLFNPLNNYSSAKELIDAINNCCTVLQQYTNSSKIKRPLTGRLPTNGRLIS